MMNKRWMLALTAAVGVGLLAVPLFDRSARRHRRLRSNPEPPSLPRRASRAARRATPAETRDFTLKDMNGANVRLADYKGKVVLLNFWATWCGPCKVEIPEFVELYSEYKDRGFVILGVLSPGHTVEGSARARSWTENKMEYPVLYSSEEIESAFGRALGAADVVPDRPRRGGLREAARAGIEGRRRAVAQGAPVV